MVGAAIEILPRCDAEVRSAVLKVFQFFAGEDIILLNLGTPRHDGLILVSSPDTRSN
jgi:hypothetical protein